MPFYDFENIETGDIVPIFFHMNDEKVYNGENDKETGKWRRVFGAPNASIDTRSDPFSASDFRKVTENKKGQTLGDLWARAGEASRQREEKHGKDPIKEKFYGDYKKKTGKTHASEKQEQAVTKSKEVSKKIMKMIS